MPSTYWDRYRVRRITRRRLLQGTGVAGAGAASLLLAGCGGEEEAPGATTPPGETPGVSPTAAATEQPKRGGEMIFHLGGSPRSLDPHFDTFPYNTALTNNVYNGLYRFTPDLSEIVTDLATALPENPDELTWIVKIQQGVKFHNVEPANGRELTAEDVKYSIERQSTNEPGKFQHAYFFLGKVDRIDTPDTYTVVFHTVRPYAPMMSYLASPWTLVINRETVEKYGDLTEHAVGTGPFIFKEWQKDVHMKVERNPDYWKQGLPYVDRVTWLFATDPDTAATMFIQKQVRAVIVSQPQLDRVKNGRPDANYKAVPSQFWRQMRMPPTTKDQPYPPPFNDKRFRQAVVQAVNPEQVLDLVYAGDGVRAFGPILPIYEYWALPEELPEHKFDLANAKKLMEAANVSSFRGPMIWATNPQADQIGEILKQQLAKIGIEVELQPMELAAYYNQTYSYKYTFSHHVPLNNPDPDENLSSYFGRNSTYYKHYNEEIFDIIDQQAQTLDREERRRLVLEAQRKIVLDFPMKFMFTTNQHEFTDPAVKGWFYHTDLYDGRVETLWLDL